MLKHIIALGLFVNIGIYSSLYAVPTLQVYPENGVASSYGPDQDTWFVSENPFDITLAVSFGSNIDEPVYHVGLLFAAPEGESGSVIVSGEGINVTLTDIYQTTGELESIYPENLTPGLQPLSFSNLNNHYPLQDNVSDFLIMEYGDVYDEGESIPNYNADGGIIEETGATGDLLHFNITSIGFSQLHIDALGYSYNEVGNDKWVLNPASHDTTYYIPVPGSLTLGIVGILMVGYQRRQQKV